MKPTQTPRSLRPEDPVMAFAYYESPIGTLYIQASGQGLTTIALEGETGFADHKTKPQTASAPAADVLKQTRRWLDVYFQGKDPGPLPPLVLDGTAFQRQVWDLLTEIPYGTATSYGALADEVAALRGKERMSAQAVGQAVGANPIAIVVPCHRVLGSDGTLTGYAGGLEKKAALLRYEGIAWNQKKSRRAKGR